MHARPIVLASLAAALVAVIAAVAVLRPWDGGSGPPPTDRADAPERWRQIAWQEVRTQGLVPALGSPMGIVAIEDGLMLWGQGPMPNPRPEGPTDTLTVWLSADGIGWRAHPIRDGVGRASASDGVDVAVGQRGILIVGGVCCGEDRRAAWWSRDGGEWKRAALPEVRNTWLTATAAGPAGFVITAQNEQGTAIWTSENGLDWEIVDPVAAGLVKGDLSDVVAWGEGFLAVGSDDRHGRDAQAAVWASTGLRDWRRIAVADPDLAGPDEASIGRILPFGAGLFATGGSGSQAERVGCERMLEGRLLTAGPATALSCGWLREMTWRSVDGSDWQRIDPWGPDAAYPPDPVPPTGRAPITWFPLVAGGPGIVGILVELVDGEPGVNGDEVGVWGSPDGRAWERIGDAPDALTSISGLVRHGRSLWAVTYEGALWVGTGEP